MKGAQEKIRKYNADRRWKKAKNAVMAINRIRQLAGFAAK